MVEPDEFRLNAALVHPPDLQHNSANRGQRAVARATVDIGRRNVVAGGLCLWALGPTWRASANAPSNEEPFSAETLRARAEELARKPYVAPRPAAPPPLGEIGYDEYRDVRFLPEGSIWRGHPSGLELQLLLAAYIYPLPVEIFLVTERRAERLVPDRSAFEFGPLERRLADDAPLSFSGFRVHGTLNRPDVLDEIAVFQGASYFRALGRGHAYGLSARGLAVDVFGERKEEFPRFTSFWIEEPGAATELSVHALLDSPNVAGAFHFVIRPGAATVMDIEAHLYPRRTIDHVGIAPLTSMFFFDAKNRGTVHDFRSAVHDSDGLAIWNGAGERLWRPLNNPLQLETSLFSDRGPRGFGLIQRERNLAAYQDLEASYERRPSAWVEPLGDWGEGAVALVEIPTASEYFDNIVAYWRPAETLLQGRTYRYAYRLHWCNDVPTRSYVVEVQKTRVGTGWTKGSERYVVDFEEPPWRATRKPTAEGPPNMEPPPDIVVTTSAGSVTQPVAQDNPETGGLRAMFELSAVPATTVELKLELRRDGRTISETWLHRVRRAASSIASSSAEATKPAAQEPVAVRPKARHRHRRRLRSTGRQATPIDE